VNLPNGDRALVDIVKLTDYCLSATHPRGRHKARVFAATLGLTADQADVLRDALLEAAKTQDATGTDQDEYGQRFAVDFGMSGPSGHAQVRSTWIIRVGEDFPRLTSCYVL
jgi:hypothetical protein